MENRYSRQMALGAVGASGQRTIAKSRAVLIGCGALGTVIGRYLAGAGVGQLRIVDRDLVEQNNLQRQILFDESDVEASLPKAVAARNKLAACNSEIAIEAVVADLEPGNAQALLQGADVVLDGTDNLETRFLINDFAVREGVPWIYSGIVSGYGQSMPILPGRTACLRCWLPEAPAPGELPGCDTVGVLGPIAAVTAGWAAAAALRILLGQRPTGELTIFDLWSGTCDRVAVSKRESCPVCGERRFEYLEGNAASRASALCGQNAVQLSAPALGAAPAFEALAERLRSQGEVRFNPYVFRFRFDRYEISLFTDARAIVKGTDDPSVARSLYARFIGT